MEVSLKDDVKTMLEFSKQIETDEFEIVQIKGILGGLKKKDGILFAPNIINVSCVKNLELKSGDTFIIGYPKSGYS